MRKKEIVNRNIGLTFDFVREALKDPSLIKSVPDKCEIEFVEKDFPVKNETALKNKHIIKVKSVFEPVNKVAEPEAKYEKKFKVEQARAYTKAVIKKAAGSSSSFPKKIK